MHSPRFQSITARFSPQKLRTSFRRSSSASSASSRASSGGCRSERADSFASQYSQTSSPISTINSIVLRHQKSTRLESADEDDLDLSLHSSILEPRPAATFCSLEERMTSFL